MPLFNIDNLENLFESMLQEYRAYHGSPYNFSEFDTSFMGKGEGAQAHGWGLYFSLTPKTVYRRYGSRISSHKKDAYTCYVYGSKSYEKGSQGFNIFNDIVNNGGKKVALDRIKKLTDDKEYMEEHPDYKEKFEKIKELVNNINDDDIKNIKLSVGQNYTVEIPEIKSMLCEFKKFENQSQQVQDNLKKLFTSEPPYVRPNLLGQDGRWIYDMICRNFVPHKKRSDEEGSLLLAKYGIPGIYYDGASDGKCAVVFSGKDITIVDKDVPDPEEKLDLTPDDVDFLTGDDVKAMGKNITERMLNALREKRPDLLKYLANPSYDDCLIVYNNSIEDGIGMLAKTTNLNADMLLKLAKNESDLLEALLAIQSYNDRIELRKDDPSKKISLPVDDYKKFLDKYPASIRRFPREFEFDPKLVKYALDADMKNPANPKSFISSLIFGNIASECITTEICNYIYTKTLKADYDYGVKQDLTSRISWVKTGSNGFHFTELNDEACTNFITYGFEILPSIYSYFKNYSEVPEFKYMLEKCPKDMQMKIIKKYPQFINLFDSVPDSVQLSLVKKNPFNIRMFKKPSKVAIELAIKMNPDVKDYIFED